MKQESGVKGFNKSVKSKLRRARVIERLQQQLIKGVKVDKIKEGNKIAVITSPLSDKDVARIEKELVTLKSRI